MNSQRNLSRVGLLAVSIALGLGGMSCADDEDKVGPVTPAEGGTEAEAGAGAGGTAGTAGVTGGGGANPDPDPVRVHVSGTAQKGPIVAGSSVNVFGLDSELEPTGTVFPSQTEDSLGSFDVSGNLTEELVEVVVQGPFYDELTGKLSETSIVLRALAAATPDTALQVNLLTTASKNRIRFLVRQGQQLDAAVAQAEDEVLSAFGIEDDSLEAFTAMDITGSTASDAALIALSAILLQYADDHSDSEGEKIAQLGLAVTKLASDLEEDGVLDDTGFRRGIAIAAVRLDVPAVTANLEAIYSGLGQSISVPDIEPFVAAVTTPAPWKFGTSMPVERSAHCACAVDNKIYVMGGTGPTWGLDSVFQYDLATDQWEPKAPLPAPHSHSSCSVVDGIIYVIGGQPSAIPSIPLADAPVEAYDPAGDAWTRKSAMPLARWRLTSTTINGKIYVVGGHTNDHFDEGNPFAPQQTDRVDVYDPAEDAWDPASPAPTKLAGHASAAVSGKIYVFGGFAENGVDPSSAAVYQYDPIADAWTPRASMGAARAGATAVALGARIYVIGGHNMQGPVGTVDEYDPSTDSWTTKTAMNVVRSDAAGVLLGDLTYVIGGSRFSSEAIIETYDLTKDP
jgi:N-acetylneuraminic acid mutarotase